MKHLLIIGATNLSPGGLPTTPADRSAIQTILTITFGIIGGIALLMVTIAGFRYITAAGDPQKISQAKNGIILALVGMVVAITAEAIIAFVVNRI